MAESIDHKISHQKNFLFCNLKKQNPRLSRMAIVHLRKIGYLIRYV